MKKFRSYWEMAIFAARAPSSRSLARDRNAIHTLKSARQLTAAFGARCDVVLEVAGAKSEMALAGIYGHVGADFKYFDPDDPLVPLRSACVGMPIIFTPLPRGKVGSSRMS